MYRSISTSRLCDYLHPFQPGILPFVAQEFELSDFPIRPRQSVIVPMSDIAQEVAMSYKNDFLLWSISEKLSYSPSASFECWNVRRVFAFLRDPIIVLFAMHALQSHILCILKAARKQGIRTKRDISTVMAFVSLTLGDAL